MTPGSSINLEDVMDAGLKMPDILGDMANQVARKLAADQDALIRECITDSIGPNWTLAAVLPRLRWEQERGKPEKMLLLDGEPLILIWPPLCLFNTGGEMSRMEWTVNYRKFRVTPKAGDTWAKQEWHR